MLSNYSTHCHIWQERSSNSHGASYGVHSGGSRLPSLREANYSAHCHIWQERVRSSHGASCRCEQSGGSRLPAIYL